jgi:cell division septal protein FtsQ
LREEVSRDEKREYLMKEFCGVIKGLAYAYLGICGLVVIVRIIIAAAT